MGNLRSIRFFSRARTTEQRGFALITAIVVAILYFALMELLLIDSARQLQEAQRFRARVVAVHLAESAAELSAERIFTTYVKNIGVVDDWQGQKAARLSRNQSGAFEIEASGTTSGVVTVTSRVHVKGITTAPGDIRIDFTEHTQ